MNHKRHSPFRRVESERRKRALMLMAALAGGMLPISCQVRFRDGVVAGTTAYVFSLLDPTLYIESLLGASSSDGE